MKKSLISAMFCFIFLVGFLVVAEAVPVKKVTVKNVGSGQVDESFVLSHLTLKAGAELDSTQLSKDVKALVASGRFSWVGADVVPGDAGVQLVFSVKNKLLLANPVRVRGCTYYREGKIIDLLGLQPSDLVDDQVMGVRSQKVTEKYRKDYYNDIKVTWDIKELDRGRGTAEVTLIIEEGSRALVKKVEYAGNKIFTPGDLRKTMKQPAWWNPCWWLVKHSYDEGEFESAKAEIINMYQGKGYMEAKVGITELPYDRKGNLRVIVTIDEGPQYKFGTFTLKGAKLFPEKELMKSVLVKTGHPASTDTMKESVQGIQDFYGSRGYVDSEVRPRLDTDASRRIVNVDVSIVEGSPSKIRNIRIEGNTRTKDKVIRRELLVYPGEIFDEVKVKRSERVIQNLGYFSTVHSYPSKTLVPDQRDLVLEVEEKRTGQFMVSAGFSSVDKVIGMFEISQGNFDLFGWPYFTGGGQKLKLTTQFGSTRKLYEISFVEPWFLDRKLSLGVDLYLSDLSYTDYDIERIGMAVTLGKPITRADRVELQYSVEKERLKDIADTNAYVDVYTPGVPYFFSNEPDSLKSSIMLTLLHDTRDNPFVPTRGNRSSLFGSVSGGPLGMDTEIYTMGLRANQYVPLWLGHVLSFRGRCETVNCYGDTKEVPITDRLFLGGGRTLRGFEYRDVGPKATRTYFDTTQTPPQDITVHRPLGGKSMAMLSTDYTIPVVSMIRLAFFFDVGNDWYDAFQFSGGGKLAMSAGAGLRLDLPGFPIKIDYGKVLQKDDEMTGKAPWVFWIGPDF